MRVIYVKNSVLTYPARQPTIKSVFQLVNWFSCFDLHDSNPTHSWVSIWLGSANPKNSLEPTQLWARVFHSQTQTCGDSTATDSWYFPVQRIAVLYWTILINGDYWRLLKITEDYGRLKIKVNTTERGKTDITIDQIQHCNHQRLMNHILKFNTPLVVTASTNIFSCCRIKPSSVQCNTPRLCQV